LYLCIQDFRMRVLICVVILLACFATHTAAQADALDRIRPENLKAVHEAIEALKSHGRKVSLSSGYDDVRCLLHVHSSFSHDSRGTIEEIVKAAREAGVRVIMFSEHPANTYDYFVDGHRGMRDGVLLIPGAETEGFLAYPRQSVQKQKTGSPQELSNLVRSTGGMIFVCHLEERMDWQIDGVTGTEIYNTHADFKKQTRFLEALKSPATMLSLSAVLKQYPQEVYGSLLEYPDDYLKRYDELCQIARHTGVSGNDAHHNQVYRAKIMEDGGVLVEDILGEKLASVDAEKFPAIKLLTGNKKPGDLIFNLDLDPYVCAFRHVSTHLLLNNVTEADVRQALADGRAYVVFDWFADPTGFVYQAEAADKTWPIGSEVTLVDGLRLRAEAPLEGRFRLVRNGEVILDENGPAVDYAVETPGVYRVEVWLKVADEERPWILTNPIYVRENK
jgi:hypothetical protein